MLIQNTQYDNSNHSNTIKAQFNNVTEIKLLVAYVKESGVNLLEQELKSALSQKVPIKIICSLDMRITSPEALKILMNMGVEVKCHYMRIGGTFHPKVWIFIQKNGSKTCLIGSANFTLAALCKNVEASVLVDSQKDGPLLQQTEKLFDDLWNNNDNTLQINESLISSLIEEKNEIKLLTASSKKITQSHLDKHYEKVIKDFVRRWIALGVNEKTSEDTKNVKQWFWRGWYIIPDQGHIDDNLVTKLCEICKIIHTKDNHISELDISKKSKDPRLNLILNITKSKLKGKKNKMKPRDLFVRQEKNYLINLGFCIHPMGKLKTLRLTDYGEKLANCINIDEMRTVYTQNLENFKYIEMPLLEIIRNVLNRTQTLNFHEFSFFVKHTNPIHDIDTIVNMVNTYRSMDKDGFINWANTLFDDQLELTAKSVRGNYEKHVRHTMSALGWCEGIQYEDDQLSLKP